MFTEVVVDGIINTTFDYMTFDSGIFQPAPQYLQSILELL